LQTQERRFRLAAFTKGACPFFADASTGGTSQGCKEFNAEVRQEIRRLKPDLVVVDSYWTWRKYYSEDFDVAAVRQTLLELQSYGTRNIIVVGPLPSWKTSLRRVIFREALKNSWAIPERSALALEDRFYTADAKLRQTVAGTTALYFPTLDKFCTPGGCVLMGDRLHDKPFLMDDSHLTSAGSELVASLMAPILFKRLFDQNPLGSKG
jgi:hypothetical protein